MKASDAMTKKVELISADATVKDAAELMKQDDIGDMPVQKDGKLLGMVTDRDIVVRAIAGGRDPENTKVREVMSRGVVTCSAGDNIDQVVHAMEENKVRRVVVLDRNQSPIGIVSLSDLAAHVGARAGGQALKGIASPVHSQ
jgi:CBS domain-containing protein